MLKEPRKYQPAVKGEGWLTRFHARLRQHDRAVLTEVSELLNEYEEEMLQFGSWQEAFEVIGVLPEV